MKKVPSLKHNSVSQREMERQRLIRSMVYLVDHVPMDFASHVDFSRPQATVPNGLIELVYLNNLEIYEALPGEGFQKTPELFVWGQCALGSQLVSAGSGCFMEVKLYPWAFELLFGHSVSSVGAGQVEMSDLGEAATRFGESLRQCRSKAEVWEAFERFACQRLEQVDWVPPFLPHAFELILQSQGQMSIAKVSEALGVSRQRLHKVFKESVGLSPKEFARVTRLRQTIDSFYQSSNTSLTQLALEANYFDQAHFIHDFKSILNMTPKAFFRQKNFIQWEFLAPPKG